MPPTAQVPTPTFLKEDAMKEYTVVVGGLEHTVLLSDEDAKRLGATEVKQAEAPANKSRTAANKK